MMILSYKLCMTIYVVLYHVPSHVIDHVTGQVFLLLQRQETIIRLAKNKIKFVKYIASNTNKRYF